MEPLKGELGGIIDIHDQLALSSIAPIKSLWSINTWHDPKVLTIDSINDGAKQLKKYNEIGACIHINFTDAQN